MDFLECRMLMVGFQISYARHPCASVPPYLSPLRVVVRRWVDTGLPRARVQRPHDGPAHRPVEDIARAPSKGRPRCAAGEVGSAATVAGERCGGWKRGSVVLLEVYCVVVMRSYFVVLKSCCVLREATSDRQVFAFSLEF